MYICSLLTQVEKCSFHPWPRKSKYFKAKLLINSSKPEDHWSCITHLSAEDMLKSVIIEERKFKNIDFVCLRWSFMALPTTRSCRASQLIVALFLDRLRSSKRLTGTKRGRPRQ